MSGLARSAWLVGGLVILTAGSAWWLISQPTSTAPPTLEIRRQDFVQLVSAEGVLKAVRSTPLAAPDRTHGPAKVAWLIDDGVFVEQGELVVRFDPTDHERSLLAGEVALSTAASKMRQTTVKRDATLEDVARDRDLAEYELEMAQSFSAKDTEIFSRIEIIEAEIDEHLAGLRLETAEGRGAIQKLISSSEMALHSIERGQAEIKIQRANQALNALEIRAPHDGIIVFNRDRRGNIKQVGDIVYGRQPIAELPSLEKMHAEVHVLEADAGDLREGARADIVVEAAPEKSFGASITRVDRMPKPQIRGVPVQYFSVVLEFDETDQRVMKPGQRVMARLTLTRLDSVLVVPRHAVFQFEGKHVVYRKKGAEFQPVVVELGPASVGSIVVEKGLEENDFIALVDPSFSQPMLSEASSDPDGAQPPSVPTKNPGAAPEPN